MTWPSCWLRRGLPESYWIDGDVDADVLRAPGTPWCGPTDPAGDRTRYETQSGWLPDPKVPTVCRVTLTGWPETSEVKSTVGGVPRRLTMRTTAADGADGEEDDRHGHLPRQAHHANLPVRPSVPRPLRLHGQTDGS